MDPTSLSELRTWLTEAGLAEKSETVLLDGFCRRVLEAGLPIARAIIVIDTLHPVHEGRASHWRRDGGQAQIELVEYGPTGEGKAAENWQRSVLFHLRQTGGSLFRVRFHAGETADFPTILRMRDEGIRSPVSPVRRQSARWIAFIPIGRPIIRTASTTRMSTRLPPWCRCSRSR